MKLVSKALAALVSLSTYGFAAHAQLGGGPTVPQSPGDIQARYQTAGLDVLDASVFGDHVDIDTGALSFRHVDVSLPGNSSLPVMFGRELSREGKRKGFLNWEPIIPHIRQNFLPANGTSSQRCSLPMGGNPYATTTASGGVTVVYVWEYWNGFKLSDGLSERSLLSDIGSPEFSPKTPEMVSKDSWIIECYGTSAQVGGEGFTATSPSGTKYTFSVPSVGLSSQTTAGPLGVASDVMYVSRIEDVHGNYVDYTYNVDKLTRIEANDGRVITITWSGDRISSVSANGRTWTYTYAAQGAGSIQTLDRVTLPDGTYWDLSPTDALERKDLDLACMEDYDDIVVRHPLGATATFSLDNIWNGRTNVPQYTPVGGGPGLPIGNSCAIGVPEAPIAFSSVAVQSKSVSIPRGGTYLWEWEYEEDNGAYQGTPLGGLGPQQHYKTRTVSYPDGHKVKTYVNRSFVWIGSTTSGQIEGTIEKIETLAPNGSIVQTQENTYSKGHVVGNRQYSNYYGQSPAAEFNTYQVGSALTRDGITYTTDTTYETDPASSDYAFGAPELVTQSSTVGGTPRTLETSYIHKKTPWVLNLPTQYKRNTKTFDEYTYNSLGQATTRKDFSVLTATYGYHSSGSYKGALASVSDALGRTTQFNDYYRGQPREFIRADNSVVRQTLDANGWVTSVTDGEGHTTGLVYDNEVGRIERINLPGSNWNDLIVNYSSLGGGIVQTMTRGNTQIVRTLDGFNRPVIEEQKSLNTNESIFTKMTYDGLGRTSFTSFPSSTSSALSGVDATYDALGRITQTRENVSPFATTTYDYLTQNRTRITDPEGNITTTYRSGYGSPDDGNVELIEQPESISTNMSYDIYGNLLSAVQGDSAKTETQTWQYDDRLRLCRHDSPQGKSTIYRYNDANEQTHVYFGQNPSSVCSGWNGALAHRVNYYDDLGQLDFIDFRANTTSADILLQYDNNGNLERNRRGTAEWLYEYDDLNNLTKETLLIDNNSYNIFYNYNADGLLESRRTPGNRLLEYNPDGFGRATASFASGWGQQFASGVEYHPNGAIKRLNYGNGQILTTGLDNRLLMNTMNVERNGTSVLNLDYTRDGNGRITGIVDLASAGGNNDQGRTFGYDGLGRLTSATGPWGSGSFSYDGVGNITEKVLGSRTVQMRYDYAPHGRLTRYRDTSLAGNAWQDVDHDNFGNMTETGPSANGGVTLTYDAANQPVTMSGASTGAFQYDGNFKRVKQTIDGETIYSVYSLSGELQFRDNVTTNETTDYFDVGGTVVARYSSTNGLTYLHNDHLGSPILATSWGGGEKWRESYTPYGEKIFSDAQNDNGRSFTGHIDDTASGLTYMQARYYNPVIGRFLANDPVGFAPHQPLMFNRYSYALNNPVNLMDPNGNQPIDPLGDFARGAASVPNAYRALATHVANKAGTPAMQARAARVEKTIGLASQVIGNDPLEALELFGQAINDQGLAYLAGRTAAQSGITFYASRKLGGKSKARQLKVALGAGTINFTATQAGSVLDGFYKLDGQLTDAGLDLGDLTIDAVTTLVGPLAAGSSVDFDSKSGQVSLVTNVTKTGSKIPREVKIKVCTFKDGACK